MRLGRVTGGLDLKEDTGMKCVNCESDDVMQRVDLRASALVKGNEIHLVSWTIERILFNECRDCGHRWQDEVKHV